MAKVIDRKLMAWAGLMLMTSTVLTADPATAAVAIDLVPPVASPGMTVEVKSTGQGPPPGGHFDLYLAPSQRVADRLSGKGRPHDERLVPIGRLEARGSGVSRLSFTVPDISPGTYVVMGFCRQCGGSTFSAVGGGLRVVETSELPDTGLRIEMFIAAIWLLFAGLLLGIVSKTWRGRNDEGLQQR